MNITTNTLAELQSYLEDLYSILPSLSLNKKLFSDGTTVGQVAFHTAQSANFYLRIYLLNEKFERNRDEEFRHKFESSDIQSAINKALDACQQVISSNIDITSTLQKTKSVDSRGFTVTKVFEVIQHVTAHTAEHFGQISSSIDKN